MEIKLSSNPDYHPIMQTDPCVSSNAPSLGARGEPGHPRLVPLPAAIPSSDETGRYAWISRSAGFCRTGSGWPAGRTLQWARPQPTEPHVVRHTYNLRRHETVDLILNSRYLGHARLMITLPTELWSNNLENKLGYNRDFLYYIII